MFRQTAFKCKQDKHRRVYQHSYHNFERLLIDFLSKHASRPPSRLLKSSLDIFPRINTPPNLNFMKKLFSKNVDVFSYILCIILDCFDVFSYLFCICSICLLYFHLIFSWFFILKVPGGQPWGPLEAEGRPFFFVCFFAFWEFRARQTPPEK